MRSLFLALALTSCGGRMLTGDLQSKAIVSFDEKWETAYAAASPSEEASKALASVPAGGEVLVVLGTWCGDSRREVSRFAKALEIAGTVPFQVRFVGVDRQKNGPGIDAHALGIRYVPTFVVSRGGKETGRVVESSPDGIERDVGALLRGDKTGVITARPPDPSPSAAPAH